MRIVINIPEESYKNIKEQVDKRDYPDMQIGKAIADGVLIPECQRKVSDDMKLVIDISEHAYNNIMTVDSISLGRTPYKGIIMSAINAIKRGEVQEPKTDIRECGSCKYSKDGHIADTEECHMCMWESKQEPKTGHWIYDDDCHEHGHCSECGTKEDLVDGKIRYFCRVCGAKMDSEG